MWKPLSIVSGVALLAAGGISYTMVRPAYLAEQKQKTLSDQNLSNAEKLQTEAKNTEKAREDQLKNTQASLTKAQSDKAAAAAKKDEVLKQLEQQNTDKDNAAKELASTEEKVKGYGDIPTMAAELKSLEGKSAEYTAQIENAKGGIANALASKANTDKLITSIKRIDLWQKSGSMPDSFTSRVTAVNPEWGFVTIAAGNASSVVNQAKLDVTRGGSLIGRVIVTHVNPNTSIAEVVPGTVNPGDSILPGDRVSVNEASRGSRQNVPAPAHAAPAKTDDAAKPEAAPEAAPAAPAADPFATPSDSSSTPAADPAAAPATPAEPAPAPVEPAPATDAPAPAPGN